MNSSLTRLFGSMNLPEKLLVVITDSGCLIPRNPQHVCFDDIDIATDSHLRLSFK